MAPRTPRGQTRNQVFSFIRDRLIEGSPPTVREVQDAFGFKSVQTAREHLENLVREGRLVKQSGVSRGYRLAGEVAPSPVFQVPVLGKVQAGALSEAVEDPDGYIGVQSDYRGDELFALKVRGDSMEDAGILNGDTVVVKKQSSALNGEIVVAMIDDEATVKRLRFIKGRPQLHPENDRFEPIIPALGEEVVILGRVVEVRRYL